MNLIHESFHRLFPEKEFPYQTELEYNRRLGRFNANILKRDNLISMRLNLQWKDMDREIKIGLIQHLLLKVFRSRAHTPNIELYNNFVKNIPILTPKTKSDQVLEASFQRINRQFFTNSLEQPNLLWGQQSFRKLASYNFHSDQITVSSAFRDAPPEILDYLLYHEMLHQYFKFKHRNGRSSFHSREFRRAEEAYPQQETIEKKVAVHLRKKRGLRAALRRYF